MNTEKGFMGSYEAASASKLENEAGSVIPDLNLINNLRVSDEFSNRNEVPISPFISNNVRPGNLDPPTANVSREDYEFSDVVLKYINQILMEENIEENECALQESAALQAAERSFYEVIGENYPPLNCENPTNLHSNEHYNREDGGRNSLLTPNPNLDLDPSEGDASLPHSFNGVALQSTSPTPHSFSVTVGDVHVDSPVSTPQVPDICSHSDCIMQFKKGVEEACKFLPKGNSFLVDEWYNVVGKDQNEDRKEAVGKIEKNGKQQSPKRSTGKKNTHREEVDSMEMRHYKQSAVFSESTVRSDMFDRLLLEGKNESSLEAFQVESRLKASENGSSEGSNGKNLRGKKKGVKGDVVDLSALLTHCAEAVAVADQKRAYAFLNQIRKSSSPMGDGMQRLAHYFSNGLEARMAGSGTQIYKDLITTPVSAADVLKAYYLRISVCLSRKIFHFYSNKTIMNLAEKVSTVHIIDIGIMWGFQWPSFIQRLSARPGGPPKLRITGIDFPNPGFRPGQRVEETGKRLANYAESFGVPFEFNAIAQKWETIKLEDLIIRKGEVLVVNCLQHLKSLLDETVVVNSPRSVVLNLIRELNPDVFIHEIVNGAFSSPLFIRRFREALFYYSSMFDILESKVPREVHERMLIEKTMLGQEAMNVIACEGAERIERPETYRQWHISMTNAGFRQLPLDEEIIQMAIDQAKEDGNNHFFDVGSNWLLFGWKGRVLSALSTWKAAPSRYKDIGSKIGSK